tara:strand:+ start:1541 stop:1750 length:210 start_codon:yes stop_codon:yes gene_type:complete
MPGLFMTNNFLTITKRKGEVLKPLPQTGTSNTKVDKGRPALLPGKRISKNGNTYWETRKNRSDAPMKNV